MEACSEPVKQPNLSNCTSVPGLDRNGNACLNSSYQPIFTFYSVLMKKEVDLMNKGVDHSLPFHCFELKGRK